MALVPKSDAKKAQARSRLRRYRRISSKLLKQDSDINNRLNYSQNVIEFIRDVNDSDDLPGQVKLRLWALKHNITRSALSDLLKILISFGLTWLPSDARTLLETKENIEIKDVANGKMWYCGIQHNLHQILKAVNKHLTIKLDFNLDGIPLFNSTKHEFWPILAKIHGSEIHYTSESKVILMFK